MNDVQLLTELTDLHALQPEWERLLAESSSNELALTPTWLLAWWRAYGRSDGRKLRVLACWEGGQLVGLVPLSLRTYWYHRVLPLRRLEALASGEREEEETCSIYLGPIAARGREALVARRFAEHLRGGGGAEVDELVLPYMRKESPMTELLADELRQRGYAISVRDGRQCPHVPLPASFDGYLEALSPKRRYLVRRSIRDLEKWAGGELPLRLVQNTSELEHGKRILYELHRERWNEDGHDGAFEAVRFRAFHESVMVPLLRSGALELMWLEARGQPVAALYTIVWDGRVYAYQMGRRCDLPKGLRPGIAIHALAIRRAIELGRREYDFGSGTSRYKSDLATAYRPLVSLRAVRPSLLETTRLLLEQGENHARALKRRLRGPAAEPGASASSEAVA